ncbi:MAG TPA: universal stress protein [Vicinamibacterales bacterium]|nr:universal stress protein [Vicinamibacterales bacterium]
MIQLKHILVATDFSEPSGVALDYGRELSRAFGATLHVVHAVDLLAARLPMTQGHGYDVDHLQKEVEEAGREALGRLVTDEDRAKLHARPVVVSGLSAWDAILDYARDHVVDLIVIGTHGRSALSRLMMGSVAERIVRTSPCPVLTVRHPEHEFLRPDALEKTTR